MTGPNKPLAYLVPMLSLLLPIASLAGPARFNDAATVLAVEPIVEQHLETERRWTCEQHEAMLEMLPIAATIGADIRRQLRSKAPQTHCGWAEIRSPVERINGYRVTYSYNGRRYTRQMQQPPGEFIPVRVALEPLR